MVFMDESTSCEEFDSNVHHSCLWIVWDAYHHVLDEGGFRCMREGQRELARYVCSLNWINPHFPTSADAKRQHTEERGEFPEHRQAMEQ